MTGRIPKNRKRATAVKLFSKEEEERPNNDRPVKRRTVLKELLSSPNLEMLGKGKTNRKF